MQRLRFRPYRPLIAGMLAGVTILVFCAAPPEAREGPATASSAMVSSAHPLATEAGLQILRSGGNAFDAAVAVAAFLDVVKPAMSGAGGYGTILMYSAASRETWFLNPSGRIPAAVNSDVFRAPYPDYLQNRRGAKSVSTPGNVHAWEAMSRKFGKLEWARLFGPAIQLATETHRGSLTNHELRTTVLTSYSTFAQDRYASRAVRVRSKLQKTRWRAGR